MNELPDSPIGCDTDLLERIVMNLLKNAIQACEEGSNVLLAARLTPGPPQLEFVVSDDGPGIPEELAERVFEPYYSARKGESSGNGLGLALCRLGARSLGGTVEFKRNSSRGAEFVVRVPAVPAKRLTAI